MEKDYISEQDFNQLVARMSTSNPEDDSKGDSAIDANIEATLGEYYAEGRMDTLKEIAAEDHALVVPKGDQEKFEQGTTDDSHEGSSTWPDASEITQEEELKLDLLKI